MEYSPFSLPYLTISLATLLILTTPKLLTQAKTSPVAPGPTPAPLNLTAILEKGSQYTTFMRLLKVTQVGQQVQSQLNNSYDGLTIFAPTDNAFNNLKAGTLNGLDAQEQVSLILYHVLPRYYSFVTFETASNPVRTQASGSNGVYSVNVTSSTNQVNVSTGIDETPVQTVLYSDFPLAVYSVDKDVSLSIDEFMNGDVCDKRQDLMTDSAISHPHHVETGRKLKHWTLDNDDPEYRELEDIFDGTWNRLVANNIFVIAEYC
ncbi:hypothetical protein J5N97_026094 [Dioscorea zingiberensis]|uniref:FAS1 domain-containing protein n=1 Tax=Dioscorea zingiberensis TaxID=325984 RepID=A0A9D5C1F6_9LILI|nr:hypothetical protein J5N97_026094 [Dioscorea zingiberensis]